MAENAVCTISRFSRSTAPPLALLFCRRNGDAIRSLVELSDYVSSLPLLSESALAQPQDLRILVIDDNVDAADMFGLLLDAHGYVTMVAYSASSGLDVEAEFKPHVVFCDLGMPGVSGYDFARKVRSKASAHRLMLVAVSAWGDERTRARTKNIGFDAHLVKPASYTSIQELLGAYRTGAAG